MHMYVHTYMHTHTHTHTHTYMWVLCVCVWMNENVLLAPFEPIDWYSWNLLRVGHCGIDIACQQHVPESKIVLNKYVGYALSLIPRLLELFQPSWHARWLPFRRQVVQMLAGLSGFVTVYVCVWHCKWMLGCYFQMNHDRLFPCLSFHCSQCCVMYTLKSIIIRILGAK